jgi:hypothetical protein
MIDPNRPPLRTPESPAPGSSDSSTGTSDPLDDLGDALFLEDEPKAAASAGPAPAAAPIPTEGIRLAVAQAFRMVEAWAVDRYGEPMRATDAEREQIIDTGTYAAVLYAPVFLSHPLTPLAFALGGWIVRGTIESRKAATNATTQGAGPDRPGEAQAAPAVPKAKHDRSGARVEGFGQDVLDET